MNGMGLDKETCENVKRLLPNMATLLFAMKKNRNAKKRI